MSKATTEKILDTAERLFAEHGVDATSLRNVIAVAKVNLAAVHYHFHNKESLLDAIVLRKLASVNAERTAMLDRFERECERPVPIEKILEAMLAPAFAMADRHPQFARLLGRVQVENVMPRLMAQHFPATLERFLSAMLAAEPSLGKDEVLWRLHFCIGAMAHTLRSGGHARFGAFATEAEPSEAVSRRLLAFLAAGFRAPLPEEK